MQKLFMMLLGGYPKNRLIEQHDIYFGIATSIKELINPAIDSWPETNGNIHIDAWRTVTYVGGFNVQIVPKQPVNNGILHATKKLFFLNLGGYQPNEFEEFHYKIIIAANNKTEAIQQAKQTIFFKKNNFKGAAAHIDEKYGIDVDDVFKIDDILSPMYKELYSIQLTAASNIVEDEIHAGYFKLAKF